MIKHIGVMLKHIRVMIKHIGVMIKHIGVMIKMIVFVNCPGNILTAVTRFTSPFYTKK